MDERAQLAQDVEFLRPLLAGGAEIGDDEDTKTAITEILTRVVGRGGRRGGPTKAMLLSLRDMIGEDYETNHLSTKTQIAEETLQHLNDDQEEGSNSQDSEVEENSADIPPGWERFFQRTPRGENMPKVQVLEAQTCRRRKC